MSLDPQALATAHILMRSKPPEQSAREYIDLLRRCVVRSSGHASLDAPRFWRVTAAAHRSQTETLRNIIARQECELDDLRPPNTGKRKRGIENDKTSKRMRYSEAWKRLSAEFEAYHDGVQDDTVMKDLFRHVQYLQLRLRHETSSIEALANDMIKTAEAADRAMESFYGTLLDGKTAPSRDVIVTFSNAFYSVVVHLASAAQELWTQRTVQERALCEDAVTHSLIGLFGTMMRTLSHCAHSGYASRIEDWKSSSRRRASPRKTILPYKTVSLLCDHTTSLAAAFMDAFQTACNTSDVRHGISEFNEGVLYILLVRSGVLLRDVTFQHVDNFKSTPQYVTAGAINTVKNYEVRESAAMMESQRLGPLLRSAFSAHEKSRAKTLHGLSLPDHQRHIVQATMLRGFDCDHKVSLNVLSQGPNAELVAASNAVIEAAKDDVDSTHSSKKDIFTALLWDAVGWDVLGQGRLKSA